VRVKKYVAPPVSMCAFDDMPPHEDAGAQLLHRAHHRAVVLQHRVDEGRQVVAVGEPVVEAVALHLSLQIVVRDVEAVLVPVAGRQLHTSHKRFDLDF